jgi:fused signal recognition particle receptor
MVENSQGDSKWWKRLSGGLGRTSSSLGSSLSALVSNKPLEGETLDDLEDELVRADFGHELAARIVDALAEGRYPQGITPEQIKAVLAAEVEKVLTPVAKPLKITARPFVILVAGVNGSGKTTTIGKLASRFRSGCARVRRRYRGEGTRRGHCIDRHRRPSTESRRVDG